MKKYYYFILAAIVAILYLPKIVYGWGSCSIDIEWDKNQCVGVGRSINLNAAVSPSDAPCGWSRTPGLYAAQDSCTATFRSYTIGSYWITAKIYQAYQYDCYDVTRITVVNDCCPEIESFQGTSTEIDPFAGGSIKFLASVYSTSNHTVSWTLTVAGRTFGGTGNSISVTWDGRTANGKVVDEGTYTARLSVSASGCPKREATINFDVTLDKKDCKLLIDFGSSTNVANGNLYHSQDLFQIQNAKILTDFVLSYNSLDGYTGPLGMGWTHSYNIHLKSNSNGSYTFMQGDGERVGLYDNGAGGYSPKRSYYPILTKNPDGTFTLVQENGLTYIFNSLGRLTTITDRNSNSALLNYDTAGNLTGITDSAGRSIALTYNPNSRISVITDPDNNTHTFTYGSGTLTHVLSHSADAGDREWVYTYDANAFMLTKTDPDGNMTTYTYDTDHRVLQSINPEGGQTSVIYNPSSGRSTVTDNSGKIWTYNYDTLSGVLTNKNDPEGNQTQYTYDSDNNLLSKTVPDQGTYTYTYDTYGNKTSETDPQGNATGYTYASGFGEVTSVTDPQGNVTTHTYDGNGNRTSTTDPTAATTQYAYDSKGNLTETTDPAGAKTSYAYDANDNISSVTDPSGVTVGYTYDASGNKTSETDELGNTTLYEYNSLNQLTKITDPLGNETTFTYDANGNTASKTDANGNTTLYEYDSKGNLTKVTDPLGNITTHTYGGSSGCASCGGDKDSLLSTTDPNGHTTTYQYDSNGNRISERDPLGNTTAYTYDAAGHLKSITDPNGNTTTYQYDSVGNRISETDPNGKTITYSYDETANLISVTDPNGNTTSYQYDSLKRKTGQTDPFTKTTAFHYDNAGRMDYKVDRKGDRIDYTYTPAGKPQTATYPGGSTVSYTYDTVGRLGAMQDLIGTTSYTYDAASRLAAVTDPHGFIVSYAYDGVGNPTALTYPGNKKVYYTYDKLNRLKTVTIDWLTKTATYAYDPAGRLTQLQNFNGAITTYTQDRANHLTDFDARKSDTSLISVYHFTLDAIGNRIQVDQTEPLTMNLTEETIPYTYNKNRITTAGTETFGFDFEGQLANKNTDSFTFDYEHRLKTISGSLSAQYSYDGKGNRLRAVRDGTTTKYIYDDKGNLLAEADASNAITRYYIHGTGLLGMVTSANDLYCYHFDPIGSTVALSDQTQTMVNKYRYTPFGILTNQVEAVPQPFKYIGEHGVMTEPNGFYYMRARYYDPNHGRFISEDPLGFEGGDVNLYVYALSNPTNFIDPKGEEVTLCYTPVDKQLLGYITEHVSIMRQEGCLGLSDIAWGFHPTGSVLYSKGEVRNEGRRALGGYCLGATRASMLRCLDEQCVCGKIRASRDNPEFYGIFTYNCHSWARRIISSCQR